MDMEKRKEEILQKLLEENRQDVSLRENAYRELKPGEE